MSWVGKYFIFRILILTLHLFCRRELNTICYNFLNDLRSNIFYNQSLFCMLAFASTVNSFGASPMKIELVRPLAVSYSGDNGASLENRALALISPSHIFSNSSII